MKKIFLLLLVTLPLCAIAQKMTFAGLCEKYSGREGFSTVEMSGELLNMYGRAQIKKTGRDAAELLDALQGIKVVINEKREQAFLSDVSAVVADPRYSKLMSVNDGGEKVEVYVAQSHTSKGPVSDMVIVVAGKKENVAVNITGDLEKLAKFENLKVGGLNIQKLLQ